MLSDKRFFERLNASQIDAIKNFRNYLSENFRFNEYRFYLYQRDRDRRFGVICFYENKNDLKTWQYFAPRIQTEWLLPLDIVETKISSWTVALAELDRLRDGEKDCEDDVLPGAGAALAYPLFEIWRPKGSLPIWGIAFDDYLHFLCMPKLRSWTMLHREPAKSIRDSLLETPRYNSTCILNSEADAFTYIEELKAEAEEKVNKEIARRGFLQTRMKLPCLRVAELGCGCGKTKIYAPSAIDYTRRQAKLAYTVMDEATYAKSPLALYGPGREDMR